MFVAAVAAACIATAHLTDGAADAAVPSDVLRSLILVVVGAVVAGLKERHLRAQRNLQQLRSRQSRASLMMQPDVVSCMAVDEFRQSSRIADAARVDSDMDTERNLLRTLIDNLPDAIYVKDREGRFVLCNPQVLRQKCAATVEEIVGKTDHDFYPKDVADRVCRAEQELMSSGQPIINYERCALDANSGARTWSLTTKVPLRNEHGEIIGLVGIGRDITDRRRAEEAYRTLVDHSLQGLVVIQDERIVFANRAMSRISGYTVEEILAKSPEEMWDFIHPEDRQRVVDNHHARLDGEPLPENYEFQIVRKDGTVRWVELHACRIEYRGRPAIHAACADVTERVGQNALRQSEAQTHALLDAIPT